MQSSNETGMRHEAGMGGPHLSLERLAAFDDAPFTAVESAHLAACAACRAEYEGMVAVVGLAGSLGRQAPRPEAPRLVEFDAILAGVRSADGTVPRQARGREETPRPPAAPVRPELTRRRWAPVLRQAAAALLLVGGGAVLGRMSGELGAAPRGAYRGTAAAVAAGPVAATPVSLADRPFADLSYQSVEQATIALNEAQREYERASLWLASNDTTLRDPEVFRARLAALDQMMEASRIALRDAPQDPVLNHYYLAAHSAREATLQALSSALPVDKIIERY